MASPLKHHFAGKIKDVGVQVCTILADDVLLAIWVVVEYWLEHSLVPRFPVTSDIGKVSFWIFRVTFAISTIGPSLVFLYRDLRIMWMRAQTEIEKETETLKASTVEQ